MVDDEPTVLPDQGQGMCKHTPWPQAPGPAPQPQSPEPPPTTTNSGDSYPQWAGVFGACDATKTSPSGANSVRSWGSRKHLGCRCAATATWRIGRWRQSPRCHSPGCPSPGCPSPGYPSPGCPFPRCLSVWCPSPWGMPGWLGRRGVNQSLCCRGGMRLGYSRVLVLWVSFAVIYSSQALIKACVEVFSSVGSGLWPCSFPLFQSIYHRHWLFHSSQGFWIAQGLFVIYS